MNFVEITSLPLALFLAAGGCRVEHKSSDTPRPPSAIQNFDEIVMLNAGSAKVYVDELKAVPESPYAEDVKKSLTHYLDCANKKRKANDAATVVECATEFHGRLIATLRSVSEAYSSDRGLEFTDLSAKVVELGDKGKAIGEDLQSVKETYLSCQEHALAKELKDMAAGSLRACESTRIAGVQFVRIAIANVGVDPLETW